MLAYHKQGISQYKIAKKLGISRNTGKKYINNPHMQEIMIRGKKRERLLAPYVKRHISLRATADIALRV